MFWEDCSLVFKGMDLLFYLNIGIKTVSLFCDSLSWLMPGKPSEILTQTRVPPDSWISNLMTEHFNSDYIQSA